MIPFLLLFVRCNRRRRRWVTVVLNDFIFAPRKKDHLVRGFCLCQWMVRFFVYRGRSKFVQGLGMAAENWELFEEICKRQSLLATLRWTTCGLNWKDIN